MKITVKDPVSAGTHFVGFIAAIPILTAMLYQSAKLGNKYDVAAFFVFGLSVLLLYGASTIYHTLDLGEKKNHLLKRIDHMMIFILIAGTYTPVCLIALKENWGMPLLFLVWGFAIGGIVLKIFWLDAPRWLSTSLYVIMGWLVMFAFLPLTKVIPLGGILLLVAGGLAYTVGAVIYALKWPAFTIPHFGFHDLFHLFVMAGTMFHVIFMFLYLM